MSDISDILLAPDRPAVITTDDKLTYYRASQLGICLKALTALRQGYDAEPPPSWLLERFQQGHDHEAAYVNQALSINRVNGKVATQYPVKLRVNNRVVITGSIDLVYFWYDSYDSSNEDRTISSIDIVDVKALAPTTERIISNNIFPVYKWQLSAYFHAIAQEYPDVDVNNITATFLIIPKTSEDIDVNISQAYEHYADATTDTNKPIYYSLDDIRQRVEEVERFADSGLPPVDCEYPYFPCPVFYLHEGDDSGEIVTDPELNELIVEWFRLKEEEKQAITTRKEIGEEILQMMQGKGIDKTYSELGTVSIQRKTNRRTNFKAMMDDGIDVRKYQTESFSTFITSR